MNPIVKAIAVLEANLLKVVKRRMLQEGPRILETYYRDFLRPATEKADRQAKKSKRLYYSGLNKTNQLRNLYGNLTRALIQGEDGNITQVEVVSGKVVFISGIDEDTKVQAGPDTVSLEYARFHEEGTANYKARPFLGPGFQDFIRDGVPDIMDAIADDLEKLYRSVR
jgi:hypothetical protein